MRTTPGPRTDRTSTRVAARDRVLARSASAVLIALACLALVSPSAHGGDGVDCVFSSSPGLAVAIVYHPDGSESLLFPGFPLPTLHIDENGVGDFDIEFIHVLDGYCDVTEVYDASNFGSLLAAAFTSCPEGEQDYYWNLRNVAIGTEVRMQATIGDDKSTWLLKDWLVSSSSSGYIPLFHASGQYEIRRYFANCGEEEPVDSWLSFPIEVEFDTPFVDGAIYFADSAADASQSSLFAFWNGSCAASAELEDTVWYVCSDDELPSDIVPFSPWSMEDCHVAEVQWQSFNEALGLWQLWEIVGGAEEEEPSLSAEEIRERLPTSGSLILRRKNVSTSGEITYTNELTIVVVKDLEPVVSPSAQDVCTTGTLEDLVVTFNQAPVGDVRYQWEGRPLGNQAFLPIAGATEPTLSLTQLGSAEYRVKLWQTRGSQGECGPYISEPVTVDVGEGAREYYPDVDGDGYPDKSGELRLLCEVEEGWAPAAREDDCADNNPLLHPGQRWFFDGDGDGLVPRDGEYVEQCLRPSPPQNWILRTPGDLFDCDDTEPEITSGTPWAEDRDRDGFSTGVVVRACSPPPGFRALEEIVGHGDCDDRDRLERPGQLWFRDDDGDGHGVGPAIRSCEQPEGYFPQERLGTTTDCDDGDSQYSVIRRWYRDADGDGFPAGDTGGNVEFVTSCRPEGDLNVPEEQLIGTEVDCDDADPEVFPGQLWYPDDDGDGLGDAFSEPIVSCGAPDASHVANHRDCDDDDADPARCAAGPDAGYALSLTAADEARGLVLADGEELGSFGVSDFLVEAWIRTSAPRAQTIISKGSPCGESSSWSIGIAADGTVVALLVGTQKRIELEGSTVVTDGGWHHIVLQRRDAEFSLSVDELREDRETVSPFRLEGTDPVIVGNDLPLDGEECRRGFVGLIDDVRIWNAEELPETALTGFRMVLDGETEGLVAYWSFDQIADRGPGDPLFVVDSARGFPLLVEAGRREPSTAPIGEGSAQLGLVRRDATPAPALELSGVGLALAGAEIEVRAMAVLGTRLRVPPAGAVPPEGIPVNDNYWILDPIGRTPDLSADLVLEFETDVITPDLAARTDDISLFSRPANSDGEWTFVATATAALATSDQVRFLGVSLARSQLAVTVASEAPPLLDVTDEELYFGSVAVGSRKSIIVPITNVGGADAFIGSLIVSGAGTAFSTSSIAGVTLRPTETIEIPIAFEPTEAVLYEGQYLIVSAGEAVPDLVLFKPLSGRGFVLGAGQPALDVTATEIDFGAAATDETETRDLTVSNVGSADLDVTLTTTSGDFSVDASGEGAGAGAALAVELTLTPGESLALPVRFRRSLPGTSEGFLQIESSDSSRPFLSIPLFARASRPGAPALLASPSALLLPTTDVGQIARGSVLLENGGDAALEISSIALEADPGSGLQLVAPTGVQSLAPGESLRVGVRFAPSTPGPRSGELVIASDDLDLPELRVPVSARALTPGVEAPALAVSRTALAFGSVAIDGQGALRSLSLGNQGSADLEITSVAVDGADAAAFEIVHGGEPSTLGAGQVRSVTLRFRPTTVGARTATLLVSSNDASLGLVEVALSGEGTEGGDDEPLFRRGDTDASGVVELTDAIALLGYLFLGQSAPGCLDAADADDNGNLELTDAIGVLGYLFLGAAAPPAPGPVDCGPDRAAGRSLGCESYAPCGN